MASCQAILEKCAQRIPELLPWSAGATANTHFSGRYHLNRGVQQGDPSVLYSLPSCYRKLSHLFLKIIFVLIAPASLVLGDGAVAGSVMAVRHAFNILEELSPQLGLQINHSKCEL